MRYTHEEISVGDEIEAFAGGGTDITATVTAKVWGHRQGVPHLDAVDRRGIHHSVDLVDVMAVRQKHGAGISVGHWVTVDRQDGYGTYNGRVAGHAHIEGRPVLLLADCIQTDMPRSWCTPSAVVSMREKKDEDT